MKGKELIEKLKGYEDFDIEFSFMEEDINNERGYTLRKFENITIDDVGHSSKIIKLGGEEL